MLAQGESSSAKIKRERWVLWTFQIGNSKIILIDFFGRTLEKNDSTVLRKIN